MCVNAVPQNLLDYALDLISYIIEEFDYFEL